MPLTNCENFCHAADRLAKTLAEYAASSQSAAARLYIMQRFEMTFGQAEKSLNEYMEAQGVSSNLNSPMDVLKKARDAGLLKDAMVWFEMLGSRTITLHIRDNKQAEQVLLAICDRYCEAFLQLAAFYKEQGLTN